MDTQVKALGLLGLLGLGIYVLKKRQNQQETSEPSLPEPVLSYSEDGSPLLQTDPLLYNTPSVPAGGRIYPPMYNPITEFPPEFSVISQMKQAQQLMQNQALLDNQDAAQNVVDTFETGSAEWAAAKFKENNLRILERNRQRALAFPEEARKQDVSKKREKVLEYWQNIPLAKDEKLDEDVKTTMLGFSPYKKPEYITNPEKVIAEQVVQINTGYSPAEYEQAKKNPAAAIELGAKQVIGNDEKSLTGAQKALQKQNAKSLSQKYPNTNLAVREKYDELRSDDESGAQKELQKQIALSLSQKYPKGYREPSHSGQNTNTTSSTQGKTFSGESLGNPTGVSAAVSTVRGNEGRVVSRGGVASVNTGFSPDKTKVGASKWDGVKK